MTYELREGSLDVSLKCIYPFAGGRTDEMNAHNVWKPFAILLLQPGRKGQRNSSELILMANSCLPHLYRGEVVLRAFFAVCVSANEKYG